MFSWSRVLNTSLTEGSDLFVIVNLFNPQLSRFVQRVESLRQVNCSQRLENIKHALVEIALR